MIAAVAVLALSAVGTPRGSADMDYAYAKQCQLYVGATANRLGREGVQNSQMGEMSKAYFGIMIEKGLAKGMTLDEIKADHLRTGADIGAKLSNLTGSEKVARDREVLNASKECGLRLIGDGDTK